MLFFFVNNLGFLEIAEWEPCTVVAVWPHVTVERRHLGR